MVTSVGLDIDQASQKLEIKEIIVSKMPGESETSRLNSNLIQVYVAIHKPVRPEQWPLFVVTGDAGRKQQGKCQK
jgi:hypothetical protein